MGRAEVVEVVESLEAGGARRPTSSEAEPPGVLATALGRERRRLVSILIWVFLGFFGFFGFFGLKPSLSIAWAQSAPGSNLDTARDLYRQGRVDEAFDAYGRVLGSADSLTDRAVAYNNRCLILVDRGEYLEAEAECREALTLRRQTDDQRGLGRTLNNLGLVLQRRGEFSEAEQVFGEALDINLQRDDEAAAAVNRLNLASTAILEGRFGVALDRNQQLIESLSQKESAPWVEGQLALARLNQAVVFEKLGAYPEALAEANMAIEDETYLSGRQRIEAQMIRGVVYRNLGDPWRALEAFETARLDAEKAADPADLSNAWINIGLVYQFNLRQPEVAEQAFEQALAVAEAREAKGLTSLALLHLGRLQLDLGRWAEATRTFERCRDEGLASGAQEVLSAALEGLGRAAEGEGDLLQANRWLDEAMTSLEASRQGVDATDLSVGVLGDRRSLYEASVRVRLALAVVNPAAGWGQRALNAVAQAKGRTLSEVLGATGDEGAGESRRDPETAVLTVEYFVAEGKLHVWRLDAGAPSEPSQHFEIGDSAPILDQVRRVYRRLASGHDPTPESLEVLSRALLGSWLESRDAGRLRIAPDALLHYLPFELLSDPKPPNSPSSPTSTSGAGERLLDRFEISYLPSSRAASTRARSNPQADHDVAYVVAEPPAIAAASTMLWRQRFELGRLDAAPREIAALARALGPVQSRVGVEATEGAFFASLREPVRVLHIAAHTVVDEGLGQRAAILLNPSEGQDGLVTPTEIARLDAQIDLAVLAACSTALGPTENGNALASLTGAFLAGGASAVVATLWDVDDAATAAFMDQFYWSLEGGASAAEALAFAKRRLAADPAWSSPSFWAGYVLVGADPRLRSRWKPLLPASAALLAGSLFLALAWAQRRRTKRRDS